MASKKKKTGFTTGQVARMLNVTAMTVINYCKAGEIEFSQSSVTGHRRISKEAILEFMDRRGIPRTRFYATQPIKALIVEDDPQVRETIKKVLLELAPHAELEEAGDGYQACLLAGEHKPALVTLDLNMPRMDGLEACKALRANPATAHAKILIITGFGTEENLENCKKAGADAVLLKPFRLHELREYLQAQLPVASGGASVADSSGR